MKTWDCVHLAGKQLVRRRLRVFLSAVSVGVGVAAMVLIAAMGMLGQTQAQAAVSRIGLRGLAVYLAQETRGQELTARHAEEILSCFSKVQYAMPIKAKTTAYHAGQHSGSAILLGTDAQLGAVMQLHIVAGQLFSKQQVQDAEPVAIVDSTFATEQFGRENVVGKKVSFTVEGEPTYFQIIGVIEPQTAALGAAIQALAPTLIYVPYSCLAAESDPADQIFIQCQSGTNGAELQTQIVRFLRDWGQVGGTIKVQDMSGALQQVQELVYHMGLLFLAVAAISFLVAMIGVMSSLLSITHEKTAEIGMFMAIGARKKDIVQLFLWQAILICLSGGIGGLLFAEACLKMAAWHWGIAVAMPSGTPPIMLGLSVLFGMLSGLTPALWASKLHPVEAMRK